MSAEKTLARLSLQIREERMAAFEAVYESTLVGILERHGLTPSSETCRPSGPGVFSRLFEIESASSLAAIAEGLSEDLSWDSALREFSADFAPDPARFQDYLLTIHTATAVGRTARGSGRGQFVEYGGSRSRSPLYEAGDGSIWCGMHKMGVGRFEGGEWTVYTTEDGLVHPDIQAICQDDDGRMWFGAGTVFRQGTAGGGLSCFDGETFTNYTVSEGLPHDCVTGVQPHFESVVVTTYGGVALHDGNRVTRTFTEADGLPSSEVLCLDVRRGRGIWFGTNRGASYYDGSRFANYSEADGLGSDLVKAIARDGDGGMWFLGPSQLSHFDGAGWTVVDLDWLPEDLPREYLTLDHAVDRSGDVWVATINGLTRFDGKRWTHGGLRYVHSRRSAVDS